MKDGKDESSEFGQTFGDDDETEGADGLMDLPEGNTVLCVRCKKALDDVANIREAVEGEKPPERLQCHAYHGRKAGVPGSWDILGSCSYFA